MKSYVSNAVVIGLVMMVIGMSETARARTDVKAKVQQMNENVDASKTNLQQYQANLGTVVSNLAATDKALKTIERQKAAIVKQTGQSAKGW